MMKRKLIISVIFLFVAITFADDFGYSFEDQAQWPIEFPQCGGKKQSPIALFSQTSSKVALRPLNLFGYDWDLPTPLILRNNGHTAEMVISKNRNSNKFYTPHISGGNLSSIYIFENLHFHWGKTNNNGSEHTINGRRYPIEVHIVHRNIWYRNISVAVQHSNGLVVLGFMMKLSSVDNHAFAPIINRLKSIIYYPESIEITKPIKLRSLLGNIDIGKYFTYRGSLTTPPCSEAVTWIVFQDILKISDAQLDQFRKLLNKNGNPMSGNFRYLQPLNGRTVYLTKPRYQIRVESD